MLIEIIMSRLPLTFISTISFTGVQGHIGFLIQFEKTELYIWAHKNNLHNVTWFSL